MAAPFKKTLDNPKSGLGEAHICHLFALNKGVILPSGWEISELLI